MASEVKKRRGRPAIKKEQVWEDYCFDCKDGGYLLVCDFKNCVKAYHPECVGKVENELETEKSWYCSWHNCLVCNKSSAFRCFGCPNAVCKGCIEYAEFVHVRNKKGFCVNCLRLALLIEENVDVASDGEEIDLKDRNTYETLFKEYWEIVKEKEGLTLEDLQSADIKLKKGLSSKNDSDSDHFDKVEESRDSADNMDVNLDTETYPFLGRELKIFSSGTRCRKAKPKKREFDGWGSKSLRDFLKSIGKDSNDSISQNEVNGIIQKYVQENKLNHPEKRKKILCDTKLQSIFGRKSVNRNKTYDLLERHFAENLEQSDENEWSDNSDVMDESTSMSCKKQRKTSLSKIIDEKKIVKETRRSCFASVTAQNIKLIYLKRSLIEEFLKNPVSFDEKVMGCFVRVKSDPNGHYQKNRYQLVQVTGITKLQGNGNIKEEVTLHVSSSENTFRIAMLSNEDFSEEEIEDLQRRVKNGSLQKLNIVDLERKTHVLHEDLTKHWIKRELVRLQNLSDRANEKGWRAELLEYLERMQLLQTPAEQQRLIQEVPKVIAEEIEVEVTTPLDLPIDENPVKDNSPRSIHLPLDSISVINMTGTEDVKCVHADIKDVLDLPMIDANADDTDRKSSKKVEDFELMVRGFVQNENAGYACSHVPRLAGSQDLIIDTGDGRAAKKEIEGARLTVSNDIEQENSAGTQLSLQFNAEINKDEQVIILEGNEGRHCTNVPLQVNVECVEDRQVIVSENNGTGHRTKKQHAAAAAGVNDLDDDTDVDLECKIWYYMDPFGATHGPFTLFKLKEWWDDEYFTVVPDFKVWKVGQNKDEAILLKDALTRSIPRHIQPNHVLL